MEKLNERLQSCNAALATLDEALRLPFSVIVRDAAIQRFEYSFESAWKLLKAYLETQEGIVCNSPKGCFREALPIGLLSRAETEMCLIMTDDRNLTSHTYLESLAERIYAQLPAYLSVMQLLTRQIAARSERMNDAQED
jgi:nucleotidyltransferase substrate binding protein (TIGR01987 family)